MDNFSINKLNVDNKVLREKIVLLQEELEEKKGAFWL